MGVFRELAEEALTSHSNGYFLICNIRVECDLTSQLDSNDTTSADKDVLGISNLLVELFHGSLALCHRVSIIILDGVVVKEAGRDHQSIILDVRARLGNWVLNLDCVILEDIKEASLHKLELVFVALDCLLKGGEEGLWNFLILSDLNNKGVVFEMIFLVNQYDISVVPDPFSS